MTFPVFSDHGGSSLIDAARLDREANTGVVSNPDQADELPQRLLLGRRLAHRGKTTSACGGSRGHRNTGPLQRPLSCCHAAPVPEPARTFDELVKPATRVLVVEGADYDPRHRKSNTVLADERDEDSIRLLVGALDSLESDQMSWMTPGRPTLVFLEDREVLVAVTFIRPDYIRCHLYDADRRLRHPEQLIRWLDDHGLPEAAPS